jgi:pyrroloquinoline-quinone synthase
MPTASDVLDELDRLIAQRSILQHPFYRAWTAGALTREDLAAYARVYYPHVASFPNYLRTAISQAPSNPVVTETLSENLHDELRVPEAHNELWLRFANAVGANSREVRTSTPAAGVVEVTGTFARLCAGTPAQALAALYAYESQQPAVSIEKIKGLREKYGICSEQALGYFTVHAEADVLHREGERQALGVCLEAGASREEVLGAAGEALDAYWLLLDAVCAERRVVVA